jgi:hypothetical protein
VRGITDQKVKKELELIGTGAEEETFLTNRSGRDKLLLIWQKKFYGQKSESNLGTLDPGQSGSGVFFYGDIIPIALF